MSSNAYGLKNVTCKKTLNLVQRNTVVIELVVRGNPLSRASSVLLFPTFWGLSYFFLLLGKIPTFSYFFRSLLKLIDKNAIFKPKGFFGLISLGIISFGE